MSGKKMVKGNTADLTVPHLVLTKMAQALFYPPHEPRKASGIYRKTHIKMIKTDDMPCWICGVRNSDYETDGKGVVTSKNKFGSKGNETHHDIIEWAAANAIDWDKVHEDYPELESLEHVARAFDLENGRGQHQPRGSKSPFKKLKSYKQVDPTEFLDGVEQMKVLCDVHHRAPFFGVHSITGPIHKLQRYQLSNFEFIPKDIVKKAKREKVTTYDDKDS